MSEPKNSNSIEKISRGAKQIFRALLILVVLAVISFIIWVANDLPPLTVIQNPQLDLSTQIYSSDGKVLGSLFQNQNRVYVELHEISENVLLALIPTEDVRFYEHSGVDPVSLLAIIKDLIVYQRPRGGSTITQQLARNLYDQIGKERTLTRKAKEMVVACILERKFTKSEILEAYLNTTSFYGNLYGIELGSRTLFSKSAKDLNMEEAAMMVGLLKGPSEYNPVRKPDRALKRRNTVLTQMEKYDQLSSKRAEELRKRPLGIRFSGSSGNEGLAPYFKSHVNTQLQNWVRDHSEYNLYTSGLKVYTTLDSRMQFHANEAVKTHLTQYQKTFEKELKRTGYPWKKDPAILEKAIKQSPRYQLARKRGARKNEIELELDAESPMEIWTWDGWQDTTISPRDSILHYLKFLETGFMVLDPKNGKILSWVGGINSDIFKYDHVDQSRRQVGSTFKPFVYARALDDGVIEPCGEVLDIPVSITLPDGKVWKPKNAGDKYSGRITYVEALARSLNVVTASVMKQVGPDRVCETAHQMGINSKLDCVPALCLGTSDLTLKEMVAAYGGIAANGFYHEPMTIERIEDKDGKIIAQFLPEGKTVLAQETAYKLKMMMAKVVDHPAGTAHSLRTKYDFKNQVAGKTGTTQNQTDGWFIGFTPELVAGAWVGCANPKVRFPTITYGQGGRMAMPIWALFMKSVYADSEIGLPTGVFTSPPNMEIDLECEKQTPKRNTPGWNDFD